MAWNDFIDILGDPENSERVAIVISKLGENPVISDTPEEYNDPLGKTRFYEFLNLGIGIGFRLEKLNHIFFYLKNKEGYDCYSGPLPDGVDAEQSESAIVAKFGTPSKTGGGKNNPLLGYIARWIRYDNDTYALRFEFSSENRIGKISLVLAR